MLKLTMPATEHSILHRELTGRPRHCSFIAMSLHFDVIEHCITKAIEGAEYPSRLRRGLEPVSAIVDNQVERHRGNLDSDALDERAGNLSLL